MCTWMIRAGRGGVYAAEWLKSGCIGIGWDSSGADIASMLREQIRVACETAHPGESRSKMAAAVGQVSRFAHDMIEGSDVVIYDPPLPHGQSHGPV